MVAVCPPRGGRTRLAGVFFRHAGRRHARDGDVACVHRHLAFHRVRAEHDRERGEPGPLLGLQRRDSRDLAAAQQADRLAQRLREGQAPDLRLRHGRSRAQRRIERMDGPRAPASMPRRPPPAADEPI